LAHAGTDARQGREDAARGGYWMDTTRSRRLGRILALGAATAVLVGACAGAATPAPSAATSAAAGSASAEVYPLTVAIATAGGYGQPATAYLAGDNGMALYVFKKDQGSTSTCTGACATSWPPFVLAAGDTVQAGSGVAGTVGSTDRADGTKQVTYNGAPVYYFAGDKKAGDTTGEGVNGVWFLAKP
jgi:predicted lipoprotein with Yx(FWY)xxD motif